MAGRRARNLRGPTRRTVPRLAEKVQDHPELQMDLEALLQRGAVFRHPVEDPERFLEASERALERRARSRLAPGLPEIRNRPLPEIGEERVVREALHVLLETIGIERLDGVDEPGVERAPSVFGQAAVGHVAGERVLERVLEIGKRQRFVEELRGLETGEAVP